jgi:D-cysteine desulfhydrase
MATPLLRRFPELAGRLPRLDLGRWPTRVHELPRLGRALGIGELWIKRDDESGERYGGNKVRKLEYLLADAVRLGRGRIATLGGVASNQVLATAIYAADQGLAVDAAVYRTPLSAAGVRTIRAALALGVRYHLADSLPGIAPALVRALLADPRQRAYVVPAGGSSPLGTIGYVEAALELAEQVRSGGCPEPDAIVVALGSGGTVAGLVLGLRLAGLATPVIAVRVVSRMLVTGRTVARLSARTARLLASRGAPVKAALSTKASLELAAGELGAGYGAPTEGSRRAVAQAGDLEGLALETTYTGKALAGLVALAPRFGKQRILFWNTYNSVDITPLSERPPAGPVPPALERLLAASRDDDD